MHIKTCLDLGLKNDLTKVWQAILHIELNKYNIFSVEGYKRELAELYTEYEQYRLCDEMKITEAMKIVNKVSKNI